MKITYKEIDTINDFIDAIRIRTDVFIIEQKCPPGWEPDELDKVSKHYVAIVDNNIVGTVRLKEDKKNIAKMERMAVKKEFRGKGIGTGLTNHVIERARKKGFKKLWMQAQRHAQKMYERVGFKTISKTYDLWNLGIPHVDMEYLFR